MPGRADHLRSQLKAARGIADQAQGNSLKAEEVLAELEQREQRDRGRQQAAAAQRARRFPAVGRG